MRIKPLNRLCSHVITPVTVVTICYVSVAAAINVYGYFRVRTIAKLAVAKQCNSGTVC
jgi:hypothetical protein